MFHINFWQIILITVVALLVFGPKQLPEIAKMLGQTIGRLRNITNSFKHEIEQHTEENKNSDDSSKSKTEL